MPPLPPGEGWGEGKGKYQPRTALPHPNQGNTRPFPHVPPRIPRNWNPPPGRVPTQATKRNSAARTTPYTGFTPLPPAGASTRATASPTRTRPARSTRAVIPPRPRTAL